MKLPITVIVLTYNSEMYIDDCLRSVSSWAGEIWVVDSGSTDRTLEIVRGYTNKVVHHAFENYSSQRNWATATLPIEYDWVFHIDADERVTSELASSLADFFAGPPSKDVTGLLVVRRIMFMGRWIKHGGNYPSYHLRVFKKDSGYCEDRLYDQHFVVKGQVNIVDGDLVDYVMSDLNTWTLRHLMWAKAEAQQTTLFTKNSGGEVRPRLSGSPIERKRWFREKLYNQAPLFMRSFLYFVYRFIFRLGFLDGKEGLVFHFLQGFWFRFYIDSLIFEARKARKERVLR